MQSEHALRPARPSLLDQLAHAGLARAFTAARETGARPLCLDGTAGNGHDTLFLVETAPEGSLVLALDVQPAAIAATETRLALAREKLHAAGMPLGTDWRCLCRGHEELENVLLEVPEAAGRPLMAAVFNFGWLPGSDKSCVTRVETSLRAVDAVLERLTRIVALRNHSPEAAQRLMRHLFLELMEEEAAAGRFRFAERRRSDERITRALAYIRENFSGNIGVADIAAAVHLGEVQLRKLFRREVGMGPAAYLQRARLIHAARLLARYDLPLGEVARRSGFSGECYFATLFRSVFARTPGQYRRYIRGR